VAKVRAHEFAHGGGCVLAGKPGPQVQAGGPQVAPPFPLPANVPSSADSGNVAHELSLQIKDACEDASCDDVAFDLGKPYFDLVEPGRVSRREAEVGGETGVTPVKTMEIVANPGRFGDDPERRSYVASTAARTTRSSSG
jgi:hypothetical protein